MTSESSSEGGMEILHLLVLVELKPIPTLRPNVTRYTQKWIFP